MSLENFIKPKTYKDRKNLSSDTRYVFISYSHKSAGIVYKDLEMLFDAGLNFWYDDELLCGEIWYQKVEECFADKYCCGAIFFFDENSLAGDAIEKEIELYQKYKAIRPEIFAYCVIDEKDESVYSVIRNVFVKTAGLNAKELQTFLPETRVISVLKAFNKDKIYKLRSGNYIKEIIDEVRSYSPDAVCDSISDITRLKSTFGSNLFEVDGNIEIDFGEYPQTLYRNKTDNYGEEIYIDEDERKIYRGKTAEYLFEPVKWILLGILDGEAKFISKNILYIGDGEETTVNNWLDNFAKIAFATEDKKMLINGVLLPDSSDIKSADGKIKTMEATAFALGTGDFMSAWLSDVADGERKTVFLTKSGKLNFYNQYIETNCGFMPVITIKF